MLEDFPDGSAVKNPLTNAGDAGLIPGSGRSPGGGNDNPLQYSFWENPMDRGAWQATVHRVTKSRTRLSTHTHSTVEVAESGKILDKYWREVKNQMQGEQKGIYDDSYIFILNKQSNSIKSERLIIEDYL